LIAEDFDSDIEDNGEDNDYSTRVNDIDPEFHVNMDLD
jgi:acyl-ACP thioesterase